MELVSKNDPALKKVCHRFDFDQEDPNFLFEQLRDTMCENKGVGLAAPQIGVLRNVFVVGNPNDPDKVIPFFNPIIIDEFGEEVYYDEGCLSFPGLWIKIKRKQGVRIRFTNLNGETDTMKFDGLTARIIQHEYDHLYGVLFTKRANLYHLEQAKKNQKKLLRKIANAS